MKLKYANNIPYISELENELINSWLEINLNHLDNNIKYLKSLLNPNTKMMSVIKADAYGHGIIEIAKRSLINNISYFGVANVAEAKLLRQSEINQPILVLGHIYSEQLKIALQYNIETIITSEKNINDIQNYCDYLNLKANVHLKIDTGMGRVGVIPENLENVLNYLLKAKHINLKGVFTHFSESENSNKEYTEKQIETFKTCIEKIKSLGFKNFITHASNSSGILNHPEANFDMVRAGISLYGIGDPYTPNLLPVLSLKSRIINIKEVPRGSYLGYCRSFQTKRDSLIGIIPLGYADGLARVLSNNQDVLINGKKYPIVGNISMDQSLIDLTDSKDIDIGDEVVLLGKSGELEIFATEWAKKSYRIPYEVLCGFGNRLPRIYIS